MTYDIDLLGGTVKVARMAGVAAPSVTAWRKRGIPADRCPAIEQNSAGKATCEQLRPDVSWHRVADIAWPWHPNGRPLIDVARQYPAATQQEARDAA
jgi:DNA-binding transcriptional regulator YdaS (Cro superfamily)